MRKIKFEVGMQVDTPNGKGEIDSIIDNRGCFVNFGSGLLQFFQFKNITPIKE